MKRKRTSHRVRKTRKTTSEVTASKVMVADPGTISAPGHEARPNDGAVSSRASSVPVVGIGASAGGLEASGQLLAHLPADTGLAFVLVQHLAAHRESLLPGLLAKKTRMQVLAAEEGSVLAPNCVFVLPADKDITVSHGVLSLSPRPDTARPHHPVDHFLRSLAVDQRDRAIGVILSGTGSDGSLGIQAIKEEGGITFAQDERSAQQPGMPLSAAATGCVDVVLPPEGIARELTRLGRHPYLSHAVPAAPAPAEEGGHLKQIFALLRTRFGIDFSLYHPATIERRLHRRMILAELGTLADYAARVVESKDEAFALFNDLLIKTTKLFRDPETFEFLQHHTLSSILKAHSTTEAGEPLRIWVPACATGEEAYSLAMALLEAAEANGSRVGMQLFASDASEAAVSQARKGRYPENISADVSAERLRRFFGRSGGGYEVNAAVRRMFVFARQDLLRDPPFSRMDLISCRNLLIYLGPEAQRRVLSALHYALKPGGVLLLGSSEGVSQAPHLFHRIDKRHKIFSKQPAEERFVLGGPVRRYQPEESPRLIERPAGSLQAEADQVALLRFTFPSFLINEDLTILQFRGDTSPYIRPAAGKARFNIVDMVREELRPGLRAAILKAKKDNVPVKRTRLRLTGRGGPRNTSVEVVPIRAEAAPERLFLVVFQDNIPQAVEPERGRPAGAKGGKDGELVAQLKKDLAGTRDELKSAIEDQETALEELQAANEELESANEELQSNNEELETSKEEIEATNEELVTVNTEMQARNRELVELSRFIGAVFDTVREPLVVLDAALRVRQANRSFCELFNVSFGETVGHPLAELGASQWAVPELTQRLGRVFTEQAVFEKLQVEVDLPRIGRRQVTLNARPVRLTHEDAPAVLLAIEDTTSATIISEQQKVIRELSTPVLPVGDRVLVLPIIGALDSGRMRQLKEQLLSAIKLHRTKVAVIDITGVATVDDDIAQSLMQTAGAARLLGASVIFTGITRRTAQALAGLGVSPSQMTAVSDLRRGLEEANTLLGYEVVTRRELTALREAMRELTELREAEAAQARQTGTE